MRKRKRRLGVFLMAQNHENENRAKSCSNPKKSKTWPKVEKIGQKVPKSAIFLKCKRLHDFQKVV
jgi:hypothetical protein